MYYKKKIFHVENISTEKLANRLGTPLYCYSLLKLRNNIINFKNYFKKINPLICFSVKSNANTSILREIKKLNCGADVVSKGEIIKAIKAGINNKKIVFSGVGKKLSELEYAVKKNILLINVESKSELLNIEKLAKIYNKKIDIGIRLNPNIDAKTIKQISTGKEDDKFGVSEKEFLNLVKYSKLSKLINLKCLSIHIGSQILNHRPYDQMLKIIDKIIIKSNHIFEYVDLGGGMGVPYEKNSKKLNFNIYNSLINKFLKKNKCKIIFEPGRSLVANAGILVSKIIYIKKNKNKTFIILDAGMNDLMRPALYGAKHQIIPSKKNNRKINGIFEFVGPICESTDTFLTTKKFQSIKEGDNLIICDVGAYGISLASNYNLRPIPAEVLIKGSKLQIIKKRQKLIDII